jgi:hypothetical protein
MSGYIAFPTAPPEAARYLSQHYRMEVSADMVRDVFDALGDGMRVYPGGPRLILPETLDRIMIGLEQKRYVFSRETLAKLAQIDTPPMEETSERASVPPEPPLSKPQDVVYSSVDERPQEKLGQQVQQPVRSQPKFRGRRSARR